MTRWALLILMAASLFAWPMKQCAMAGQTGPEVAPHRAARHSCCDPEPTGHGVPAQPCAAMACCVLFVAVSPPLTLSVPAPAARPVPADAETPDTHSVRPPTPPPRAAGIA